MNLIARLALLAAGLLVGGAAQANCKPLLDALNKAAQQSRFGVYEVQSPEQALSAEADVVIVGRRFAESSAGSQPNESFTCSLNSARLSAVPISRGSASRTENTPSIWLPSPITGR